MRRGGPERRSRNNTVALGFAGMTVRDIAIFDTLNTAGED
jgi:hypothetical protein